MARHRPRSSKASPTARPSSTTRRSTSASIKTAGGCDLQGPTFGDDWLLRAAVAVEEPYINLPQEALYPVASVDSSGNQLTGSDTRLRHPLRAGPVAARGRLLVGHALQPGRQSRRKSAQQVLRRLADTRPGRPTPDGSLDIRIQNTEPASGPADSATSTSRPVLPHPPALHPERISIERNVGAATERRGCRPRESPRTLNIRS